MKFIMKGEYIANSNKYIFLSALCVCHTVQVGGTAHDSGGSCEDKAEVGEAKEGGFTNPTFEFGSTPESTDHLKEHQVDEIPSFNIFQIKTHVDIEMRIGLIVECNLFHPINPTAALK